MTDQAVGRSSGLNLKQRRQRAAFWFLAPMLIALFVVAAWPLLRTIWFSLTDATLSNLYDAEWIGFKNYLQVRELSSGKMVYRGTLVDPAWWNAVWNTVRFSIVSVVFETIFGSRLVRPWWSTPASSRPAQPTSLICCRRGRLSPKCSPTTASCGIRLGRALSKLSNIVIFMFALLNLWHRPSDHNTPGQHAQAKCEE